MSLISRPESGSRARLIGAALSKAVEFTPAFLPPAALAAALAGSATPVMAQEAPNNCVRLSVTAPDVSIPLIDQLVYFTNEQPTVTRCLPSDSSPQQISAAREEMLEESSRLPQVLAANRLYTAAKFGLWFLVGVGIVNVLEKPILKIDRIFRGY